MRGKGTMKKWVALAGVIALFSVLARTPGYWNVFSEDKNRYETDLFYGIIREEYVADDLGRRIMPSVFSDLQDGDILVTDSTYCFIYRHGHAALVVDAEKGVTLESFGIGTKSRLSSVSEWRRYPHVLVLRLNAPEELRSAVAQYAKENLVDIPYSLRTGMIDDKDMDEEYWGTQCAHLVWVAFKKFGYDIDGDNGWLVTPADFVKSPLLYPVSQNQ